jgi:hypothetical protein
LKPDIVSILQREGIELRQKGRDLWACCPLHNDKTPSFKVSPERQTFHCFGCGAGGDVISFIQAHRKLTFKEAVAYLGIDKGRQYRPDLRDKKKRTLVKDFKTECVAYSDRLGWELRGLRRLVQGIRTEEDLELRAWAYHEIPVLDYKLDVLCYGSDESRYLLYKEVIANESTI